MQRGGMRQDAVVWPWVVAWAAVANVAVGGGEQNTTTSRPTSMMPTPAATPMTCEDARIKCALREGCGMALQNYMLGCADLISGKSAECDPYCRNSLIALTSTEEGHALMDCVCSDDYCRESKQRVEVCRVEVLRANANSTVVTCSVAHWICSADTLCSTAITYYDRYCRKMFLGKECSFRCNNSLGILQRQAKAAKLASCTCDGTEPFDCEGIKNNTARLCFPHWEKAAEEEQDLEEEEERTNQVDTSGATTHSLSGLGVGIDRGTLWTAQLPLLLLLLLTPAR
ncbi:growth arrest-specific protein 1-like isoform X1 [Portunus trituberculatus]|uniref:growth arrest-specific protein 1-like isoform X1 n=2 Tax=Portunus trituberculatus TaxID=210409 RepID=UPI001E1CC854|nr:growth arrest-specific protein 1-like isoform X1 [Portunus trituberculatus]